MDTQAPEVSAIQSNHSTDRPGVKDWRNSSKAPNPEVIAILAKAHFQVIGVLLLNISTPTKPKTRKWTSLSKFTMSGPAMALVPEATNMVSPRKIGQIQRFMSEMQNTASAWTIVNK
jgi:hypothetical protein